MQVTNINIDQNKMETTQHGSFAFPMAIYQTVMSKNVLGFVNWHWHEEIQFCLVTSGEIRFFVNESQYLLRTGDGIFINSGHLHMSKPETRLDSAYVCIDIGLKLLSFFQGSIFEERYVAPYIKDPAMECIVLKPKTLWQKEVLDQIKQLFLQYEKKGFGYEFEVYTTLSHMWLTLLSHKSKSTQNFSRRRSQNNVTVRNIMIYINQHFYEKITMGTIESEVLFSKSECCRLFKKVTGETIFSYLKNCRLTRAMELLQATQLAISQIAYETGFCSTSYFIETFKATFKMTPLQYRCRQSSP